MYVCMEPVTGSVSRGHGQGMSEREDAGVRRRWVRWRQDTCGVRPPPSPPPPYHPTTPQPPLHTPYQKGALKSANSSPPLASAPTVQKATKAFQATANTPVKAVSAVKP